MGGLGVWGGSDGIRVCAVSAGQNIFPPSAMRSAVQLVAHVSHGGIQWKYSR